MGKKPKELYLMGFTGEELIEIYEGLVLRDELKRRLNYHHEENFSNTRTKAIKSVRKNFTKNYTQKLKQGVIDELDDYLDHVIDDEVAWMQIENELKKLNEE